MFTRYEFWSEEREYIPDTQNKVIATIYSQKYVLVIEIASNCSCTSQLQGHIIYLSYR